MNNEQWRWKITMLIFLQSMVFSILIPLLFVFIEKNILLMIASFLFFQIVGWSMLVIEGIKRDEHQEAKEK